MRIRVIDFETTGTEPTDGICEIGWTDVIARRDVLDISLPKAMLVHPGRPIPPEARAVHHISNRDIEHAPPVVVGLQQLMEDQPCAFCAHNARFERQFFGGGDTPWICTRKVAMRVWPDAPNFQNQTLRYLLDISADYGFDAPSASPPHRAGPDTYVTAHILSRALALQPVEQLIKWSNEPSLLPGSINFGKHKGTPWSRVETGYLEWMVKQADMDEDARFTARHWLNRRRADAR